VVVSELDTKHRAREDGNDFSLEFDCFFGIHGELQNRRPWKSAGSQIKSAGLVPRSGELTRAVFASTRFVDGESASLHFLAVEGGDGRVGFRRVGHGDERKAARAAGGAVHHQGNVGDFAVFFEKILEIVFSGLKREITYVQFHCDFLEQYLPATEPFPRIGFQITTEENSTDDLPRNEQNRT